MCGLIGMHTVEKKGFTVYDKDEFKQMLVLNSLRGIHSTGVAGMDMTSDRDPAIVKSVGSPYSLLSYDKTSKFMDKMVSTYTTIIGHGRYATRGKVDAINAHPFEEGHIVLAHNGTISNFFSLKDFKKHKDIDVDSHLIAKLFEEEGAENVLPRIEGAYVFTWYDTRNKTLNLARNIQRPLFIGIQTNAETIVWASEEETLRWNASRNKTPLKEIYELPTYEIHTYSEGSLMPTVTKYTQAPVKSYKSTPYIYKGEEEESWNRNTRQHKSNKKSWNNSQNAIDAALLTNLKESSSIQLHNEYAFIVDDYTEQSGGYTLVKGHSKMYPNVLFRTSFNKDISLDDLFNADFVQGTATSLTPTRGQEPGFAWQVFLTNSSIVMEGDDAEERVNILNVNGASVSITKYRLREISSFGCAWCQGSLTRDDLSNPSKILIQEIEGAVDEIVCPICAVALLDLHGRVH